MREKINQSSSSLPPNSPAARIVVRESPSWVKTAARIEISSALNVLEIAQEREDIKVTNSHGFKIITPLSVYDDCGGK